jgi:hypothetical protein
MYSSVDVIELLENFAFTDGDVNCLTIHGAVHQAPEDTLTVHKVYRDLWERRLPREIFDRDLCVVRSVDYPEDDADGGLKRLNEVYKHYEQGLD